MKRTMTYCAFSIIMMATIIAIYIFFKSPGVRMSEWACAFV